MNEELTKQLTSAYPNLYKTVCYFEHGDGWFNLIKDLSEKLRPFPVVADQVKEKFGGLRFYVHIEGECETDLVYKLIQEAESKSYRTCELTGEPGKPRASKTGWIHTVSDKIAIEKGYKEIDLDEGKDD